VITRAGANDVFVGAGLAPAPEAGGRKGRPYDTLAHREARP
jgi:hypothetical protein